MFEFVETVLPGCFEIRPRRFEDKRGLFIKTFHREMFAAQGLNIDWREEYYSVSYQNVLRGLHFQLPPHDHEKLVYCVDGEVLDAFVDLRKGSPTYGRHAELRLSSQAANMLYLPRGIAHGFLTLSKSATMMYKVSRVYVPEADVGILWNSVGIDWPLKNPLVSERDESFPALEDFYSPFNFEVDAHGG